MTTPGSSQQRGRDSGVAQPGLMPGSQAAQWNACSIKRRPINRFPGSGSSRSRRWRRHNMAAARAQGARLEARALTAGPGGGHGAAVEGGAVLRHGPHLVAGATETEVKGWSVPTCIQQKP